MIGSSLVGGGAANDGDDGTRNKDSAVNSIYSICTDVAYHHGKSEPDEASMKRN